MFASPKDACRSAGAEATLWAKVGLPAEFQALAGGMERRELSIVSRVS